MMNISAQKSALTRAKRTGDPSRVLRVCRDAARSWVASGQWPDQWHTWNIAALDAAVELQRNGEDAPFLLHDIDELADSRWDYL